MVSFTLTSGTVFGFEEVRGTIAKSKNIGDMSEMRWGRGT